MSTLSRMFFRSFSIALVLAIALLLAPSRSFAATTTAWFACPAQASFGILHCVGPWQIIQGDEHNPSTYLSTLIGDVNTAQVAGTQAAYLACTLQTNPVGVTSCSGTYQIFQGSAPSPGTYQSWFIGYVYTSAVAGTEVTYLACTLQTVFGITKCSGDYEILQGFTPSPSIYQTWLIGYVAP